MDCKIGGRKAMGTNAECTNAACVKSKLNMCMPISQNGMVIM